MSTQPQLLQMVLDPNDIFYTPDWIARDMVEFFKPSGRILEPSKGAGVFMKCLPPHAEWCEIEEGRDFFKWVEPVDWVFGNPPYNIFKKWMAHSFSIARHIVYLIPITKVFNSYYQMLDISKYGGVVHVRVYGAGRVIKWPMGFAIGAVHFQRDYHGPMYTTIYGEA